MKLLHVFLVRPGLACIVALGFVGLVGFKSSSAQSRRFESNPYAAPSPSVYAAACTSSIKPGTASAGPVYNTGSNANGFFFSYDTTCAFDCNLTPNDVSACSVCDVGTIYALANGANPAGPVMSTNTLTKSGNCGTTNNSFTCSNTFSGLAANTQYKVNNYLTPAPASGSCDQNAGTMQYGSFVYNTATGRATQ